jgi:hypothetical protein
MSNRLSHSNVLLAIFLQSTEKYYIRLLLVHVQLDALLEVDQFSIVKRPFLKPDWKLGSRCLDSIYQVRRVFEKAFEDFVEA